MTVCKQFFHPALGKANLICNLLLKTFHFNGIVYYHQKDQLLIFSGGNGTVLGHGLCDLRFESWYGLEFFSLL
jgi:hypothetical protein